MVGNEERRRDIDIAIHAALAVAIVAIVAATFGYAVPELFDRHETPADLGALAISVGTLAFAFVAGRHLVRSMRLLRGRRER